MSIRIAQSFVLLALLALLAAAPLSAKPASLTVRMGENWIFAIERGQPVRARKVEAAAEPKPGEIRVTLRAMMGTTMTITSNKPIGYTYRARLLGAGKTMPDRSCTLPANGRTAFEHWPQQSTAVRLSDFKPAPSGGNCP